jgi:hypothetical protein
MDRMHGEMWNRDIHMSKADGFMQMIVGQMLSMLSLTQSCVG